jgi:membrane protein YqaA with SNARE-associated domain
MKIEKTDILLIILILFTLLIGFFAYNVNPNIIYTYGYFGIIFISALWTATMFFPLPSHLILITSKILNPFLVCLCYAIGATIGESSGYLIGYLTKLSAEKRNIPEYKTLKELLEKYGIILIIIFAATPLPLDALSLVIGYNKYDIKKYLVGVFIGKLISALIAVKIINLII